MTELDHSQPEWPNNEQMQQDHQEQDPQKRFAQLASYFNQTEVAPQTKTVHNQLSRHLNNTLIPKALREAFSPLILPREHGGNKLFVQLGYEKPADTSTPLRRTPSDVVIGTAIAPDHSPGPSPRPGKAPGQ